MIAQKIQLVVKTAKDKRYLDRRIEFARLAWNKMLAKHQAMYEVWSTIPETKKQDIKIISKFKPTARKVRDWLKDAQIKGYEDCTNMIIEMEAEHLDKAFKAFFKKIRGYPKFKKENSSFSIAKKNQSTCRIDLDNKLHLDKNHLFKLTEEIKYKNPKQFIFSKEADRYYVSIIFNDEPDKWAFTEKACGIDIGLETLISLVDSDDNQITYNIDSKELAKDYKKVDDYTRILSKKQKGSKGYQKIKLKRQRQYQKIKNKKSDFYKKTASKIVKDYDEIGIETLSVKEMQQNKQISHSLQAKGIGELLLTIKTKAALMNKKIIEVNKFFASSQICSNCGQVHKEMKNLSKRTFICDCGFSLDRDLNAATNILRESQRIRAEV